jgi:hypothetical protein
MGLGARLNQLQNRPKKTPRDEAVKPPGGVKSLCLRSVRHTPHVLESYHKSGA